MKKLVVFIIIIFLGIVYFLNDIFGYSNIDLSKINENEKEAIIELLNLEDFYDEIVLEEMLIPKTYKDIYYSIYFNCSKALDIENLEKTDDIYIEIEKLDNDNYYVHTSKMGKSIEILEEIRNKYQK